MTVTIKQGHVLEVLAGMADESVHMVWTSPPYWGLRSYKTEPQVWGGDLKCEHEWLTSVRSGMTGGISRDNAATKSTENFQAFAPTSYGTCDTCGAWRGEHGLEPRFDLWLAHEVAIFREVRRVLRKDGTLWLNCGDAYAAQKNGRSAADQKAAGTDDGTMRDKPFSTTQGIFKAKDRIMMPARLAMALHEDGWWLRDEIVLHKLNPMPSSVKDRTCPAHEMLYMFSKRARYFYDFVAIQEPLVSNHGSGNITAKSAADVGDPRDHHRARSIPWSTDDAPNGRLKRSVWSHATEPWPLDHFATAPTAWVEPCILAGTSAKGVCRTCKAPWMRQTKNKPMVIDRSERTHERGQTRSSGTMVEPAQVVTTGWAPSCSCPDNVPVPATILDVFGGAGTSGLVAERLGRDSILIEINESYCDMARARIRTGLGRVKSDRPEAALPLFGGPA